MAEDSAPRPIYSMRLGHKERKIIAAAAAQAGAPVSTYIRRSALAAARRELSGGDDNG